MKFFTKNLLIILSCFFSTVVTSKSLTVNCQLTDLVKVSIKKNKIERDSHLEKAKTRTIIKDLNTKTPMMTSPDVTKLTKLKENKGVYWVASLLATSAVVMWMIDTNKKIIVQNRSVDMFGLWTYSQSWMGKCK